LRANRNRKMARSAHAYVRGNTQRFYDWLEAGRGSSIPDGPPVWICGDCHSGNLGPVADADGNVEIQIRDLDQTVVGNPAHDLVRLSLSLATAIRGSDLPGVTTARMLEAMVQGYAGPAGRHKSKPTPPKPIQRALDLSTRRRWRHLARERIEDTEPTIPLGPRFWPVSTSERANIAELFSREPVLDLIRKIRKRDDGAEVSVVDCAYWMKGCSSLGNLRFAVLAEITNGRKDVSHCLIDIKEAIKAIAPRATFPMPKDNAQRVLLGARNLSPNLGERMVGTTLLDRSVFLRELLPQDLKLDLDTLNRTETESIAHYLAGVVGRAHARQMQPSDWRAWRKLILASRSKTLDAPSWLWTNLVDLIVSHEQGYLEHCRRYAMEKH
jgi:uncharacterized protein (DUF2252 family)